MTKHEELKALVKGMNKADCVGCHEYFMNRYGADSVGPIEDYLPNPAGYWTVERIHAESLKYETRGAFQKGSPNAYAAALRLKIMGQVCAHMKPVFQSHTTDSIAADALKYETRLAFQKGSPSTYKAAHRLKILDEVCAHMTLGNKSHTAESIAVEALKYDTRKEFKKGSNGACFAAKRLGIMEQVCSHMPKRAKRRSAKK
jgi:hypothetical protein